MIYDTAIIGGGPAGLSAAVTAAARNLSAVLFDAGDFAPALRKSHSIKNYLGMPDQSGKALMDAFLAHAKEGGAVVVPHKVLSVMSLKDHFYLATPGDIYEAKTVILAPGVAHGKGLTGEADYLGRGISYCATCDGNFYKGKHIGVITTLESGWEEVLFLASLAAEVDVWATYPVPAFTEKNIRIRTGKPTAVEGGDKVTALKTTEGTEPVDGIFILRETDPLEKLLPGLKLDGRFIAVNRQMATSVDGVFAAGDRTGLPWQINKAAGEGQVALLSAASWLQEHRQ